MRARTFIIAIALLLPGVAFAAPRTFAELANTLTYLFDNATAVLIVAGLVVYFWGISTNILKFADDGMEKVRAYFFWGIIVLFMMVSIWGVLRLLQNTLFGGDQVYTPSSGGAGDPSNTYQSGNLFNAPLFNE